MQTNAVFQENKIYLMDGGFGTMLQKSGLPQTRHPDLFSITHPELVTSIHKAYVEGGADLICANTFGTNAKKLAGTGYTVEQVVKAAVCCAKHACAGTRTRVMLDVGPIGEMLVPGGTLSFEQAYEIFREIVTVGEQAGADLVKFATMTDLYEVKAAVLAAKENTKLPILASMTFEATGRTFTGCCVEAMAATLEGLCVDGIGINCSMGPAEILPLAQRLCACTSLPVFIKPNAGLPDPATGEYNIDAEDFWAVMQQYLPLGVQAMGGCCGTTPAYIARLHALLAGRSCAPRAVRKRSVVCSATTAVKIEGVTVIGERINPTGKPRMKQALKDDNLDYLLEQALEQAQAGAKILDVNVGLPGIDEKIMMCRSVQAIQSVCDLPLQLDSTRPDVLEAGLRVYNGKPVVNSVNAEQKVLDTILPLCRKYGAAVVGLTLDENGIPQEAGQRFALAERIVNAAIGHGIPREDVYIDCLTLTASAQQEGVLETLRAVRMVKERLGVKTVLGISNISFGLPCREQINESFLTLALAHGLDLPILNPNNERMMAAVLSFAVLYDQDRQAAQYIARFGTQQTKAPDLPAQGEISLHEAVLQGLKGAAALAAAAALKRAQPEEIINSILIPALDEVGDRFEKGTSFLPQLLQSAGAAMEAFGVLREAMEKSGAQAPIKGKIVIATVKGDIHDIGKNIVKTLLSNYGYDVIDLGRDVPAAAVVQAVRRHEATLVGLSALMTTTLGAMQETITALHKEGLPCKVMVGGAVLTPEYAKTIGADFYVRDAKASVDVAKTVLG